MSKKRRPRSNPQSPLPEWPSAVMGGKFVRMLEHYVRKLRADEHGNRELFLDDVFITLLLAFYNPTLRSLRTIEDFSQTRQAQRFLSITKLCRSTLSDFNRMADPSLLRPLIEQLSAEARQRMTPNKLPELPDLLQMVEAVDGSFFRVAADVAWAFRKRTGSGRPVKSGSERPGKSDASQPGKCGARLDLHLNVMTWLPTVVDVSGSDTSEAEHAAAHITPGVIRVYDRGIFSFDLVTKQHEAGAFFVHRLREAGARCPQFVCHQERPLIDEDRAAGVVSDHQGRFAGSTHCPPPDVNLREIVIVSPDEPHSPIRLLTNLLDVPAWVIGLIYRYRWQIELFFRWLKVWANFEHLISESREGILLNFYIAVIGVLLQCLHTGSKVSKYTFSLLGLVAAGQADLDEILPILEERNRQIERDKASLARRRAKKQS
jgi:hypothetical protein